VQFTGVFSSLWFPIRAWEPNWPQSLGHKGVPKYNLGTREKSIFGGTGVSPVQHRLESLCHQQGKHLTENRKLKTGF
jgi:hypothetical protein